MSEIIFNPIGIIHSPFKEPSGTPIQTAAGEGVEGSVEIFPEYAEGVQDLGEYSHIILIYHFHLCTNYSLTLIPYMDTKPHGLFATRAPCRPNPIGLSVVRLLRIEQQKLFIRDMDIIDGTPLLDLKPYVPEFDVKEVDKRGWLTNNVHRLRDMKADGLRG